MASIARYTRFVALSKRSLWGLVGVMVVLVVWIASDSSENGTRIMLTTVPKTKNLENLMYKPHYQGVDAQNRPYTVTAEKATQLDADNIALVSIKADMTMNNGAWMALNAGSGLLNTTTKQLELKDGVDMFYEGGYEFRSDHAHVDMQQGSAFGDSPVEGQGPPGTLKAKHFRVSDKGKVIHFNDSVRMKLYR